MTDIESRTRQPINPRRADAFIPLAISSKTAMQKLNVAFSTELSRRDTIRLRSIVKYDPRAPRATTPMMVGRYVVARRPLHGSVHTLYMIMDGSTVAHTSISAPSADDCRSAIAKHERRIAAALTEKTTTEAKRKPRAAHVKEAA
ncbi:beta-hexosaminidase [Paraburkholderia sp. D15]|uniref:beta-hexosaminidase n=1 Tax=Paraburkholderia sp. D15 TaxID=2880218 RepID=UPI00247A2BF7|nr:beta-hexosaminidase [Paraburkholderia sp. D15]WGS50832.1 beta-hexosaminidase [Paraburkholderia sp. D15]